MSTDLIALLRERLDEDERAAQRADGGPWRLRTLGRHDQAAISTNATTGLIQLDGGRATTNGVHIARHDPAFVLADIAAKRALITAYEAAAEEDDDYEHGQHAASLLTAIEILAEAYGIRADGPTT